MSNNTIDAETAAPECFLAGAKNLELNKEWINDLNVFPVPDGDTGTNMTLTILSAVKEVQNLSEVTMETLSKAISSGSLRGARGNSGVILSQLFRGFTKEIEDAGAAGSSGGGARASACDGDCVQGSYEAEGRYDSDGCQRALRIRRQSLRRKRAIWSPSWSS